MDWEDARNKCENARQANPRNADGGAGVFCVSKDELLKNQGACRSSIVIHQS